MRRHLLGAGPLFPVPDIDVAAVVQPGALAWCAVVGALAGVLSATLTAAVYAAEELFGRVRAALDVVAGAGRRRRRRRWARLSRGARRRLRPDPDHAAAAARAWADAAADGVKAGIWAVSLGSGTSGGVLAPLLIMGSALGVVETAFLPAYGAGFWPLVSMAAILAGTMRAPLTGARVRDRADRTVQRGVADPDRRDRRAHVHGAGPQAVDPDREGRAPRLPRDAASTRSIRWRSCSCAR